MRETEATFWDAEHWRKDPVSQKAIAEIERLQARVAEEIASLESAIADVERLQSELNTALERVKVLEAVVKDIAGISLSNPRNVEASLEYAVGEARAVLQSSR